MTRMAIHTAAGFIILGSGFVALQLQYADHCLIAHQWMDQQTAWCDGAQAECQLCILRYPVNMQWSSVDDDPAE